MTRASSREGPLTTRPGRSARHEGLQLVALAGLDALGGELVLLGGVHPGAEVGLVAGLEVGAGEPVAVGGVVGAGGNGLLPVGDGVGVAAQAGVDAGAGVEEFRLGGDAAEEVLDDFEPLLGAVQLLGEDPGEVVEEARVARACGSGGAVGLDGLLVPALGVAERGGGEQDVEVPRLATGGGGEDLVGVGLDVGRRRRAARRGRWRSGWPRSRSTPVPFSTEALQRSRMRATGGLACRARIGRASTTSRASAGPGPRRAGRRSRARRGAAAPRRRRTWRRSRGRRPLRRRCRRGSRLLLEQGDVPSPCFFRASSRNARSFRVRMSSGASAVSLLSCAAAASSLPSRIRVSM